MIAQVLDQVLDLRQVEHGRVVNDAGFFRGQIHGHILDAGQAFEVALDGEYAIGAGHALDGQLRFGRGHAVAQFFHQFNDVIGGKQAGVIDHVRAFRRQVDRRLLDAGQAFEVALDGGRTVGAGHPGDGKHDLGLAVRVLGSFSGCSHRVCRFRSPTGWKEMG